MPLLYKAAPSNIFCLMYSPEENPVENSIRWLCKRAFIIPLQLMAVISALCRQLTVLGYMSGCIVLAKSPLSARSSIKVESPNTEPESINSRKTPECWKNLNHLLDLYSKMPEPKTVTRRESHSR